tara:strand:- start:14 stop:367 length:354 start_codon:yes stop_codon:yes gene_type:complete
MLQVVAELLQQEVMLHRVVDQVEMVQVLQSPEVRFKEAAVVEVLEDGVEVVVDQAETAAVVAAVVPEAQAEAEQMEQPIKVVAVVELVIIQYLLEFVVEQVDLELLLLDIDSKLDEY